MQFIVSSNPAIGMSEFSLENDLTIFPNPVENNINIEIEEEIFSVSVINIYGKSIFKQINSNKTVDVSDLVSGVYLVKIELENEIVSRKIIKR